MNLKDIEKILEAIPGSSIDYDNQGQIIIYTGLMEGLNGEVVPFLESDENENDDEELLKGEEQ